MLHWRGSSLRQQRRCDVAPLIGERNGGDRPAGAAVPVCGVARIPFLPVKIGVDPRGLGVVDVLRDVVRLVPVAFRVVPEREEQGRQAGGWSRRGEGCLEFCERHVLHVIDSPAELERSILVSASFSRSSAARNSRIPGPVIVTLCAVKQPPGCSFGQSAVR